MTINISTSAGKASLDTAPAGQIADLLRAMSFGHFVRAMPARLVGLVPVAATVNPYVNASAQSVPLPDDAKAAFIFRAYGRAGSGTLAALTIDTPDPTGAAANPSAGHIAFSPNGDIVVNAGDAWTALDVLYMPEKYDVVELTLPVGSSNTTLVLPTSLPPVLFLMEAEGTAPTDAKLIVDAAGTPTPGAGHAALDAGKLNVIFHGATGYTQARVKLAVAASLDLNAFLESTSNFF